MLFRFLSLAGSRRRSAVSVPYDNDANTNLLIHSNYVTTTIQDSSSFSRSITNNDVSQTTQQRKIGSSSLYFDGNDSLVIGTPFQLSYNSFTMEAWIRPSNTQYSIMSKWYNTGAYRWDWYVSNSGTRINFKMYNNPPSLRTAYATVTIPTNVWTHVAVTRDSTDGSITFFINGIKQTTLGSIATNPYSDSDYDLTIGNEQGGTNYFVGYMDEIRVSNIVRWTSDFTPNQD